MTTDQLPESEPAIVAGDRPSFLSWLRRLLHVLRAHQWAKNLLVFVPPAAAHLRDPQRFWHVCIAFFSLSLAASAGYVINDLRDQKADAFHAEKRFRAIASGQLSRRAAVGLVLVLLLSAVGVASLLGPASELWLLSYFAGTVIYTLFLKRIEIVDVLALAGLYAIRLFIGAAAAGVPVSEWLLTFSMFLFFSLALVKRYAEADSAVEQEARIPGRPYGARDAGILKNAGIAAAYVSVLVFAFYLNSEQVRKLYSRPGVLWLVCPLLLYWTTRMWFIAQRGEMHNDPIVTATTDPASWAVAAILIAIVVVAI